MPAATSFSPAVLVAGVLRDGQAHKEGRHRRQVRDSLWSQLEEADQEDRSQPALEILLHLLRQVLSQASGCWDLEVQGLQQGPGWWCLHTEHGLIRDRAQHDQAT